MSDIKDFVIEDGVLVKYTGNGGDVEIPEGVTSIGNSAFRSCSSLMSVTIPEGVTSIGDRAFWGCSSLTSVTIPENVTSIGNWAFTSCSNLTSVTIPEGVTSIGIGAFNDCSSLKSVYYSGSLESWVSMDKGKWGDMPLRNDAGLYCNGELVQNLVIPEGVTCIWKNAFSGCGSLTSVVIPEGVTSIGDKAFFSCSNLTSVTIPEGVTNIGERAFNGCSGLTSLTIPESVMSIGNCAFKDCRSLRDITIPEGVTSIEGSTFNGCSSLTSVTIPEGVTSIGDSAFYGCRSLTGVMIPESVTSIGDSAFEGCSGLTGVTIPEGVTSIGDSAFSGCSGLTGVTIPEGMTSIGDSAFSDCSGLTDMTIPSSVTNIGYDAFSGYCNLTSVTFKDIVPGFSVDWFGGKDNLPGLIFPENAFATNKKLTADYCKVQLHLSDKEIAWLMLYQKGATWKTTLRKAVEEKEKTVFDHMLAQFADDKKASASVVGEFVENYAKKLTPEQVKAAMELLEKRKYKEFGKLKENPEIAAMLSGEVIEENPIEAHVREFIEQKGLMPGSKEVVASGIRYADSELKCSIDAVAFIISEYIRVGELAKPKIVLVDVGIEIDPEKGIEYYRSADADRVAAALNPDDLSDLAYGLINNGKLKYRTYMPLWGRFARGRKITYETEDIYSMNDPRWRSPNVIEALLLNDSIDAMLFEYRIGNLKKYAQLRGRTVGELRDSILEHLVTQGVHCEDGEECCSKEDIIALIKAFEEGDASAIETARSKAEKLNRDELSDLLTGIVKDSYYTLGCKVWVRYANEESVQSACEKHIHMSKGFAAPDVVGGHFYYDLVHSDTRAAMQTFDKYGELDRYAQLRGMTAMEVRDSMMLPAFDFDADGVKRYDIGGNTIEVSIAPDLSFRLFDVNKQKEARSFPKKSDDPAKAEACTKEFAAFKKEVLAFAKARTELLHKMHMSGEYVRGDLWQKVYMEHPVISKLARLVVWQDEAQKTFMIADDGIIDSQSTAYAPQGKIRVAHVLNMEPTDIVAWQQWLAQRGCVQLFEQVWEPVIYWRQNELSERYSGAVLTNDERNAVKKALKLRGVDMRAAEMDREYNHRLDKWEFSNQGTMLFGDCLRVDYTVDEETKAITFGKASSRVKPGSREMNATLLEMDKATLSAQITRDNDAALTDQALSVFSAAQLASLLNLAIDHKATRCTARLLDYKNAHFPEFAEVNEFSLDW